MSVPLLDLKAQWAQVGDECRAAMEPVLDSAYYVMGPQVKQLEQEVAAYSGAGFGIGCANGSDAIVLALMALGVGPGDEVIVPTFTFFATAGAVSRVGATPVFADCDPVSFNLLPSEVERLATPNTRAVIPVHLFGQCCDMDTICEIAASLGIRVVEDAAQSIVSQYKGRRVGNTGGDIATYSFFPSKNLGCLGDGGMCVTNDQELAELMGILRVHGSKPKYYHKYVGFNSRLDSLQAAVLSVKLRYLDSWHEGRRRNAEDYDMKLAGVPELVTPSVVDFGYSEDGKEPYHIYNQYTIRVTNGRRDEVVAGMKERGIGCEVYYPVCLHQQQCYSHLGYESGDLPHSEKAALEVLSVPIYPELTEAQRDEVAGALRELVGAAQVGA